MNSMRVRTGFRFLTLAGTLTLAGCFSSPVELREGIQSERLAACTADGSVFETMPFKDWDEYYHGRVEAVIEAHLESLRSTSTLSLQCTTEKYEDLLPASDPLIEVAKGLTAYKNVDTISESDMASVLLEFLRIYECSMKQREAYLPVYVPREYTGSTAMNLGEYLDQSEGQRQTITEELLISRIALERTLSLVGGYDRLRLLNLDIECLKRTSLDLRNVLGLAADASACLPRARDTHGSLRDLME